MAIKRNRNGLDSAPNTSSTPRPAHSLKRRKADFSPASSPSTGHSESESSVTAESESETDDQRTGSDSSEASISDGSISDGSIGDGNSSDSDEHGSIDNNIVTERIGSRNSLANSAQMARHERDFRDWKWQMRLHYHGYQEAEVSEREDPRKGLSHRSMTPAHFSHGPDVELWCERIVEDKGEEELESDQAPPLSPEERKRWLETRARPLVGAGMCWTAEEGNRFFHGLRRFGKHNVWAIQAHIRSRSLAEVVAMIQVMEMEVARRHYFRLGCLDVSSMPMADEVDQSVLKFEEACASKLLFRAHEKKAGADVTPATAETATRAKELLNDRAIIHLQHLLRGPNQHRTISEVQVELLNALKSWLTAVIEEMATLQHERHRVSNMLCKEKPSKNIPRVTELDVIRTLRARMLPLDVEPIFERLATTYPGSTRPSRSDRRRERKHRAKYQRLNGYDDLFEEKAVAVPNARFIEQYEPGYGILPKDASFMYDITRPPPKAGFGLGQREHGGLFFMDRQPHEQYSSSGYITVSDTEDEEEEERGWTRQMQADEILEQAHTILSKSRT